LFAIKKDLSLTAKITLGFTGIIVLILTVYTYLTVKTEIAVLKNSIDTELAMAAKSYVKVIGEEKLDRAFTASVPEEEYKADVLKMGDYANELGLKFLYSMTIVDSKVKYLHDGAPQSDIDSGDFSYPMGDYEDASPKVSVAWNTWKPHYDEYTDSFGTFRSYFMPIITSGGHKLIIGVDMAIDGVKQKIRKILKSQILTAISILFFSFIAIFLFARMLAGRIIRIGTHIHTIAIKRDFTNELEVKSSDEIGKMTKNLNELQDVLKQAIGQAYNTSLTNASHSKQFSVAAESIQSQVASSAQQVEHLNEQAVEINKHAQFAAQSAVSVKQDIDETNQHLADAHMTLMELVKGVNETAKGSRTIAVELQTLNDKVGAIANILNDITEISDQTTMLAMNASIEAAHAGNIGRGFAVVADSVRALAGRTQKTVAESEEIVRHITQGIDDIIGKMAETVKLNETLAKTSSTSLDNIEFMYDRFTDSVAKASDSVKSSDEIKRSVASIMESLNTVGTALDSSRTQAEEIFHSAAYIRDEADDLTNQLSSFKV